ncbi:LYR motif-containing protein 2 isoform X1 [Phycodurus eques]|uniref:LYR motif-containing protein 2 isoform X1 n=1 Tax=Phycodurus eques TaxID=693459 RepID=UPI002ACD2304|nr:LYR motif-containing protein 2 isoform X1 [Phycodurus eques]
MKGLVVVTSKAIVGHNGGPFKGGFVVSQETIGLSIKILDPGGAERRRARGLRRRPPTLYGVRTDTSIKSYRLVTSRLSAKRTQKWNCKLLLITDLLEVPLVGVLTSTGEQTPRGLSRVRVSCTEERCSDGRLSRTFSHLPTASPELRRSDLWVLRHLSHRGSPAPVGRGLGQICALPQFRLSALRAVPLTS